MCGRRSALGAGGQERSKPAGSALAEGPTLGSQLHRCTGTGPRTADPVAHQLPRCVKRRRMNSLRQDFRLREPGWCPGQGRDCVGVSPWLKSDVEKIRNRKGGGPLLRMQSVTPLQRSWPEPTSPPGLRCQSRVSKQGQTGSSQRDPTVVAQVHGPPCAGTEVVISVRQDDAGLRLENSSCRVQRVVCPNAPKRRGMCAMNSPGTSPPHTS